jgi:dienelactone hydrolase
VKKEAIDTLTTEFRRDKVDWQMIHYGNAAHSFTNPEADKRQVPGLAYNKKADERSWAAMRHLFDETFV